MPRGDTAFMFRNTGVLAVHLARDDTAFMFRNTGVLAVHPLGMTVISFLATPGNCTVSPLGMTVLLFFAKSSGEGAPQHSAPKDSGSVKKSWLLCGRHRL